MQILRHLPVLQRILRSLLRRRYRGIELAELVGEAHADFEGVRHLARLLWGTVVVFCEFLRICFFLVSPRSPGGKTLVSLKFEIVVLRNSSRGGADAARCCGCDCLRGV